MTGVDPLVERKIMEHFAPESRRRAREILSEIETPRVQLAAIKLSDGSLDALAQYELLARIDWRDVIAPAESPRYLAAGPHALQQPGIEFTVARDEADYQAWLANPGPFAED